MNQYEWDEEPDLQMASQQQEVRVEIWDNRGSRSELKKIHRFLDEYFFILRTNFRSEYLPIRYFCFVKYRKFKVNSKQ